MYRQNVYTKILFLCYFKNNIFVFELLTSNIGFLFLIF